MRMNLPGNEPAGECFLKDNGPESYIVLVLDPKDAARTRTQMFNRGQF